MVIPAVIAVFALFLKQAVGPYWLSLNNDPSYIYLMNALYLVGGISPIFIQHPGITLQLLMAGLIKMLNFSAATPVILDRAFTDPEYFLNATYFVLLAVYLISLIAVGYYALKKTRSSLAALLIQSSAFLFLTMPAYDGYEYVLTIITNINAETLLISITNLYVIGLLKLYFDETKQAAVRSAVLLGLACALGVMTKLAFLPMLLLALFLLPGARPRMVFVLTFFILVFLLSLPIAARYGEIYKWIQGLIVYDGVHGSGKANFINPGRYVFALGVLIKSNWVIFAVYFLSFLAAFYYYSADRKPQKASAQSRKNILFWLAMSGVALLQFAMVAKQPATRYLVPAAGMMGLVLYFVYQFLQNKGYRLKEGVAVFLLLFMIVNGAYAYQYQKKMSTINQEIYNFSQKVFNKYKDCVICPYYRSSSPLFALEFGDDCSGFKGYAKLLKEKYPTAHFYHFWGKYFHDFTSDTANLKQMLADSPCVLLYGQPYQEFPNKFLKLEEIESSPNESVYKILATTAEEAVTAYLVSKRAAARQHYKDAYIFALKAQSLGFPNIDEYILQLKTLLQQNQVR